MTVVSYRSWRGGLPAARIPWECLCLLCMSSSQAVFVGLVKANQPCLMGRAFQDYPSVDCPLEGLCGRHSCESPHGKRSITHSLEHRPQVKYIVTTFKHTATIYISSKNKISHPGCIPKACVRRVLKAVLLKEYTHWKIMPVQKIPQGMWWCLGGNICIFKSSVWAPYYVLCYRQ